MIYIVCANPALDRLLILPTLKLDEVNRTLRVEQTVGGKGINVARAIQNVGGNSKMYLFVGGEIGQKIVAGLDQEKFSFLSWPVIGETRITTVIHEEQTSRHTVINEDGPLVSIESAFALTRTIEHTLTSGDYLILSGSLPRGLRKDYYAILIAIAQRQGALAVLDSSGESLRVALSASPYMIKPNVREAEEALGFAILSLDDKIKAVHCFLDMRIPLVILSDGPRGLVVGHHDEVFIIKADNTFTSGGYAIGSGDTLVGVVVAQLSQQKDIKDAIRFGTACGLANTYCPGAGIFDLQFAHRLMDIIIIEKHHSSERG